MDPARAVGDLLDRYVGVVDDRRIEDWPALFAPEASYSVVTRENVERGLRVALVLDDTRARINDRVRYIQDVWEGHFNDYYPRHVLSRTVFVGDDDPPGGIVTARTSFAVYLTEPGSTSTLLAVGEYADRVTLAGGEARFVEKRVVLDTSVLPRYFVYPL